MAWKRINDSVLSDIADAIREKNGATTQYTPVQMAAAIEAIETGGGGSGTTIETFTFTPTAIGWYEFDVNLLFLGNDTQPNFKALIIRDYTSNGDEDGTRCICGVGMKSKWTAGVFQGAALYSQRDDNNSTLITIWASSRVSSIPTGQPGISTSVKLGTDGTLYLYCSADATNLYSVIHPNKTYTGYILR